MAKTTKDSTPKSRWGKNKEHDFDLHDLGDDLKRVLKKAKDKYDAADDKTKKGIMAGIAGATALIAGAIGYKKIKDKKK